jgi:DnaJ-class molecular chaperone
MKTALLVAGSFALFARGCAVPADDAAIVADLACETARMAVQQDNAPVPSDKCQNCNGTGKLGDGKIVTICPVCKGTGKKP